MYIAQMGLMDGFKQKSNEAKAIEAYNQALKAKYEGNWRESLKLNQLADRLRPGDEATIWNLGIAATALSDWDEARRAWRAYGIKLEEGAGEVSMPEVTACVRLKPKVAGEVVWGTRIDPARMRVANVPLPESERRFGDIVINDGAPEGTRVWNGREYPVLDELGLWKMSAHSTFEVELTMPNESAAESLRDMCHDNDLAAEDWGSVRMLCTACSRGNPGEHVCTSEPTGRTRFGFAAKSENELQRALREWVDVENGARVGSIALVVSGLTN
jgi:hypothetical protein